ncbi:HupE/UreJ family protein [Pikeienuella sp. HZG-20]|uniref:HupE/UreJ family protein n=1 Tax=Paludibacillus litoralis TaxID=3133267 RepID=UPI0030EE2E3D
MVALAISFLMAPGQVSAHEVRPAYLQIDQIGKDRFSVLWRTPVLSGQRLPVLPRFSDGVKVITGPSERELSDSLIERSIIESDGGLSGRTISFVGLQATITDVLVRVKFQDGAINTRFVRPSQPWIKIQAQENWSTIARSFVVEGIEHILFGFDHLLFVAALMLIVRNLRVLVKTITAFTIAHSITLTFAALEWIALPSGPVEIMIAFSIVLIGAEIIAKERGRTSLTSEAPWVVAFAFGLLHGFGFAGALTELGLPQGDIPLALFCFNLGVEIGQLMFVIVVLTAIAALRRIVKAPRKAVVPSGYAIGMVATFWAVERVFSTFA